MIEIINNQKKVPVAVEELELFTATAIRLIGETGGRAPVVVFVNDKRMRELNQEFRGKRSTTDVLSFPFAAEEFEQEFAPLGDIVISAPRAQKQALENSIELEIEIKQLMLHGILHLCGYDHETDEGEMNRRELHLRAALEIDH